MSKKKLLFYQNRRSFFLNIFLIIVVNLRTVLVVASETCTWGLKL